LKVFVNSKEITIFRGATVIDAVRAYSGISAKLLLEGKMVVADRFGNLTLPDGELTEDQAIFIQDPKKPYI
jgi:hypothetical protein